MEQVIKKYSGVSIGSDSESIEMIHLDGEDKSIRVVHRGKTYNFSLVEFLDKLDIKKH